MPTSTACRRHGRGQSPRRSARGLSRLEAVLALILIAVSMSLLLRRLAAWQDEARPLRLRTVQAAVRSGAAVFHARCQARQASGHDCQRIEMNALAVRAAQGWPAATPDGIARAAMLPPDLRLAAASLQGRPALRIALPGPRCELLYVEAASPGDSPVVDIVDATCQ